MLRRVAMLLFSHPLWNASAPNEVVGNFRRFAQKSVAIATFLERSDKEGQIDRAHPCTCPENLMKIGPVHSQIGRNCSPKEPLNRK